MQVDEVLRTFAGFFEQEGIRYAVAGGLALQAWGSARLTHDVDFLIDGTRRQDAIDFAESLGYETVHESAGYSNHYHSTEAFGHNIAFLLTLPDIDRASIREYFSQHGLLRIYDELEKDWRG